MSLERVAEKIVPGLVYGVVLARGGSKGIPRKNLKPIAGTSLVAWAILAGRECSKIDEVICATEDEEIAREAVAFGAKIPFRRSETTSNDVATDLSVFEEMLDWMSENDHPIPELIVQLRPTTPFRDPEWIADAVSQMLADNSISCVRSVAEAPHTPYKMWRMAGDGKLSPLLTLDGVPEPFNMPRQALPKVFWHTGQIDVIRTDAIAAGSVTGPRIQGLELPAWSGVDIDGPPDLLLADIVEEERSFLKNCFPNREPDLTGADEAIHLWAAAEAFGGSRDGRS